jgi:O-antigen ligase
MILLAAFIYYTFKNQRFLINSLFIIILSGFFQSFIAIYQFIYQKSLFVSPFLHKITGETSLSPNLPGIAKITVDGEKMIRAYGTFPHPNLLGGFLILSIFISIFLYKQHNSDHLSSKYQHFRINNLKSQEHLISLFWFFIFMAQFLAIVISFSRSAWLGLIIGTSLYLILYAKYVAIVSRETIKNIDFKKYKDIIIPLLITLIVIIFNIKLISNRTYQDIDITSSTNEINLPQNDAFNDRNFFNNVSRETISRNLLLGSGPGTSIFQINSHLQGYKQKTKLEAWQYQPAHNIYLLSASEIGVVGFILFLLIIIKTLTIATKKIVSRETIYENKLLLISLISVMTSFLFIGFFDHYLWTLQQGQLIFWITTGMLLV